MNIREGLVLVIAVGIGPACSGCGESGSPLSPSGIVGGIVTSHPHGICGVTTADSRQVPTLTVHVIPEGDPLYVTPFHHCIKVYGVDLLAVERFSEPLLRHVASITAEYLDNNEDGMVDDAAVNAALVDSRATMYLVDEFDKFSNFDIGEGSVMHTFGVTVAQHNGETHPQGTLCGALCGTPPDATLEEVLHLIQQGGYATAHPDLSMNAPSLLTEAMAAARTSGSFDRDDVACRPDTCAAVEYFYWGLTSLLGAQGNPARCAAIAPEWELCTRAQLQANDTKLYALLTNPAYNLPTRLPDGRYR